MKFGYAYKTADNKRHEDVFEAKTKDDVYSQLKARGIRPIKVWPLEAEKRVGKWVVAAVLLLAVVGGSALWFAQGDADGIQPEVRKQLSGDALVIEQGVRSGWVNVFGGEGERWLAKYAQPGWNIRQTRVVPQSVADDLARTMSNPVRCPDAGVPEHRQICAIVEGMKRELCEFVKGGGSVVSYLEALDTRQDMEISIYRKAVEAFEVERKGRTGDALCDLWMRKNAGLKAMGIKLIPPPADLVWE